jgi:hypothetical protein
MPRSIRIALALTALLALTVSAASIASAGGRKVLDATMTGMPAAGTIVHGVTGPGAIWVIDEGRAQLFADGRLHVVVEGLVIPGRVPPNPVDFGRAVVTCGDAIAAMTDPVPFSDDGDAIVDTVVTLPSPCLGPAVFFTNTATPTRWFAVTGF